MNEWMTDWLTEWMNEWHKATWRYWRWNSKENESKMNEHKNTDIEWTGLNRPQWSDDWVWIEFNWNECKFNQTKLAEWLNEGINEWTGEWTGMEWSGAAEWNGMVWNGWNDMTWNEENKMVQNESDMAWHLPLACTNWMTWLKRMNWINLNREEWTVRINNINFELQTARDSVIFRVLRLPFKHFSGVFCLAPSKAPPFYSVSVKF